MQAGVRKINIDETLMLKGLGEDIALSVQTEPLSFRHIRYAVQHSFETLMLQQHGDYQPMGAYGPNRFSNNRAAPYAD